MRMPAELKARIDEAAEASGRSMNAEIVARLQESFDSPRMGFGPGSVGDQLLDARQDLEKAQQNLNDSAINIADKILDRMQERGLVLKKEVAEAMILNP
jgi:translation elongation factor EF-Ts